MRQQKIGATEVCHEHEQSEDAVARVKHIFEAFPEDLTSEHTGMMAMSVFDDFWYWNLSYCTAVRALV